MDCVPVDPFHRLAATIALTSLLLSRSRSRGKSELILSLGKSSIEQSRLSYLLQD